MSIYILLGVPHVPFHGDESTQLYMSRDFYWHLVDGDWQALTYVDWDAIEPDDPKATQQDLRLKDGSVPKYLYGLVGWASGYTVDDLNEQWLWGAGWEYNHQQGHVPPRDLLLRARVMSALLMALGVVGAFIIGLQLGGRGAAYVASAYLALNPALLLNGRRAMMEGGLFFFSVMVILMAFLIAQRGRAWQYLALGVMSGLAVATKHTAVIFVALAFVMCGAYAVVQLRQRQDRTRHLRHLTYLGCAGVLSLVVFYAVNPVWWGAPVARAQEVLTIRADFIDAQLGAFGGYADFGDQLAGFWEQVVVVPTLYAETDVDDFLGNLAPVIAAYEGSVWHGVSPGGTVIGAALLVTCVLLGMLRLWRDASLLPALKWMASTWLISTIAFVLFVTPLEWQRYYLPVYAPLSIFLGLGLVDLAGRSYDRLRRIRP